MFRLPCRDGHKQKPVQPGREGVVRQAWQRMQPLDQPLQVQAGMDVQEEKPGEDGDPSSLSA